jgi:hypothetical protein
MKTLSRDILSDVWGGDEEVADVIVDDVVEDDQKRNMVAAADLVHTDDVVTDAVVDHVLEATPGVPAETHVAVAASEHPESLGEGLNDHPLEDLGAVHLSERSTRAAHADSDPNAIENACRILSEDGRPLGDFETPPPPPPLNDSPWTIGVGTLRNLTGHGNGSPVDSGEVVRAMGELGALGPGDQGAGAHFEHFAYAGVVSSDSSHPFTGQGASGESALSGALPVTDAFAMARFHRAEADIKTLTARHDDLSAALLARPDGISDAMEQRRQEIVQNNLSRNDGLLAMSKGVLDQLAPTVDSYRNPLASAPWPIGDGSAREVQARLLLEQPISTLHRDAYGDQLPTRGEVIAAAAHRYDLDPAVLGGIILGEQRDQSRREDVVDLLGATVGHKDTSIGLGQVLVSTAMRDGADLLSDTVSNDARAGLTRDGVARLLTSDEHNIMATARYVRALADMGADVGAEPGSLPEMRKQFPGLDTDAYRTSTWGQNVDNVRALASEYTSKPWDDKFLPCYSARILMAVEDVRRIQIFSR